MLILFQPTAQYDPGSISKAPSANTFVNARVFSPPRPGQEGRKAGREKGKGEDGGMEGGERDESI